MILCVLSECNFFRNIREKKLQKKSGDVNPHSVQCLKPQSKRAIWYYKYLLTKWYYYIFLRLLFWLLVFLRTRFFWKIFSKQSPSLRCMTYLNKNSINQSSWKQYFSPYSWHLCLDLCLMLNFRYFSLKLQEINYV